MKTFVFVFLTSFLLYVTAAPAAPRRPSSRLTDRDRRLLSEVLCMLRGKSSADCLNGGNDIDERKRLVESPAIEEEEEAIPPVGLAFHGMPDRRDAFYSDWRRRK